MMSVHLDTGPREVFRGQSSVTYRHMYKGTNWHLPFRWRPDIEIIGEVSCAVDQ